MKLIIVLAMLGAAAAQQGYGYSGRPHFVPAPLAHDGRVVDTAEINQAKSAHFAAHEAAKARLPNQRPYVPQYAPQQQQQQQQQQYNAPRNQNYNDYDDGRYNEDRYNNEERFVDRYNDDSQNQVEKRWRGPFAKIEFTQDGKFIKETPEVAHARAQHLAALAQAQKSAPGVGYEGDYNGQYQGEGQYNQYNNQDNRNYQNDRNFQGGNGNYQEDDGQYRGEAAYENKNNWQQQQQPQQQQQYRPNGNNYY